MLSHYDLLTVVAGTTLIVISALSILAIYNTTLGALVFKERHPSRLSSPVQQKRLTVALTLSTSVAFIFGLSLLFQFVSQLVCFSPQVVFFSQFGFPVLGYTLLLLALRAYRSVNGTPVITSKPFSRRDFYLSLFVCVICLGVLYWALRSWPRSSFETLDRISMVSPTEGWAIGNQYLFGLMYRYQNGVWQRETIPDSRSLTDIAMISQSEGWAVSDRNTMLHYKDGSWSTVAIPTDEISSIDMLSPEEGWAVGNHGVILHYSNNQWIEVPSPTDHYLAAVDMVSPTEGWIVGGGDYYRSQSSIILHYEQGQWVVFSNPTTIPLTALHMLSETHGWAVGGTRFNPTKSVILEFRNGIWNTIPSPTPVPLTSVSMSSDSKGWAVGGGFFSLPFHCEDGNQTVKLSTIVEYQNGQWKEVARPRDVALQDVAMIDEENGWIVGWNTFWKFENEKWRKAQDLP